MKKLIYLMVISLWLAVTGLSQDLTRFVLTTSIENKEPVDSLNEILSTNAQKIYCYTKFSDIKEAQNIKHVWLYKGKTVRTIPLPIEKSFRWRTWSYKNLYNFYGEWEVQVTDNSGKVYASQKFEYKEK